MPTDLPPASAAQSQLFVFSQTSISSEDFDNEVFLKSLDLFASEQSQNWINHWEKYGDNIILVEWNLKYQDYLANDGEGDEPNLKTHEETFEDINQDRITASNILEGNENITDSWQALWQQHSEEIYFQHYIIYNSVCYHFYEEFKKSIQLAQVNIVDPIDQDEEIVEEELSISEQDVIADLEQLRLFGLPTSFGGRSQQVTKKRSRSSVLAIEQLGAFSSEDDDNGDNCDSTTSDMNCGDDATAATADMLHEVQNKAIQKKKKKNRKLRKVPASILEEKGLLKYWHMRFSLFSRFDEGIRLDRESWFSVTPEKIAAHQAKIFACGVIIDAFCGCGGNSIQFAKSCNKVIAIDIDPLKLEMAKHNAGIYGVSDKIEFIEGDYLKMCEDDALHCDVVFLSPPWGGPSYKNADCYDVETQLEPVSATELMEKSRKLSKNIALYLPRNSKMQQLIRLAGVGNQCKVERNYLNGRLVAITAIYGNDIICENTKASCNLGFNSG